MEIEGLTGDIKFNDDGRRVNYTLHVVEMTVNSAMVCNGISRDIYRDSECEREREREGVGESTAYVTGMNRQQRLPAAYF